MTENPPPPSGTPEGVGSTPPSPQNPYGSEPSTPPPPPQNPYASQPPPPPDPYAGNPPNAGQSPYGAAPTGQNPYGAESYPVSPGGPAPVAGTTNPGVGFRFLGRLLDGVIFLFVNIILSLIIDSTALVGLVGTILYVAYFVYMESSRGQTFGKQVLKMRVHGASGGNPTMEESLRRNSWALLGVLSVIPLLGILAGLAELVAVIAIAVTIAQDPLRRGWHDKFGNSTVTKEA